MADWTDLAIAGVQMAGQATNAALSYGTHKADRKFNAEQARLNREWQEEMWNKANAYNHPAQVMQRLREAGLNPNLVYGDGAKTIAAQVGSGSSASAPVDRIQYPDINSVLTIAPYLKEIQSRIDLNNAKELETRENAKKIKEETSGREIENMWNRDSYQLRLDLLDAESRLKTSLEMTEVSKRNEIEANIEKINKEMEFFDFNMWNQDRLTTAQIHEIDTRIENSIKQTAASVALMNAEAKKAYADAWLAGAEAAIKSDPRYKEAAIQKEVEAAYKAMFESDTAEIEYRLAKLAESLKPKQGSAAWHYEKFIENWINPLTRSIGNVFGGGVSVTKKM